MPEVKDVLAFMEELAPMELKLGFDNVGLLAGTLHTPVERVLVALDITDEVIGEARDVGAELIVSHHPLFFDGLKAVTDGSGPGKKVVALLQSGISAICMHTNLDAAAGGVNDALCDALGLHDTGILTEGDGLSRVGELEEPMEFNVFLPFVCEALHAAGARYHYARRRVSRVGVCGGSGGGDLALAAADGCDTFLTGDVKHHQFLEAKELGVNLIDAGHFPTENVVVPAVRAAISQRFPELLVITSLRHKQPERFYMP